MLAHEAQGVLSAFPTAEDDSSYIRRELEICIQSVKRGTDAIFVSEWFIGWLFTRHVAESAIRVAWVAAGADGTEVRGRIGRLAERDRKLLLQADKAIVEETGTGMILNREEVVSLGAKGGAVEAPASVRTLANEAHEPGVYQIWRWASVLVHPGFGNYLHGSELFTGRAVQKALHLSFATLTVVTLAALRKMNPDVEPPDLNATLATLRSGGYVDLTRGGSNDEVAVEESFDEARRKRGVVVSLAGPRSTLGGPFRTR